MLGIFVFFSVLDIRCRKIKLYWFVGLAIIIVTYKIFFEFDTILSDGLIFGVCAILILMSYFTRLFAAADLLGMLILSFAVPYVGPFPTGIFVLIFTLIIQSYVIIFSNISYNISDLIHYRTLFSEIPHISNSKVKSLYWFAMARRRRIRDKFILSAEKTNPDGSIILSVKKNNKLYPDTRYVFSAQPQFVFSTVAFFLIWFVSLGMS